MSSMASSSDDADWPSDAKKQRVSLGKDGIQFDGPVEGEETAKRKLRDAGFEEGNLTQYEEKEHPVENASWSVTPMGHFSSIGDLKMCRYLLSKGASTVDADVVFNDPGADNYYSDGEERYWFPIIAAADSGSLTGCQWLYNNGAQNHIRGSENRGAALTQAWHFCEDDQNSIALCKWLILKGALQKDSSGLFCQKTLRSMLSVERTARAQTRTRALQAWAEDAMIIHEGFMSFMMGTLKPKDVSTSELRQILHSKLKMESAVSLIIDEMSPEKRIILSRMFQSRITSLRGTSGIFEIIADFVGVARGRELRIIRQLKEALA